MYFDLAFLFISVIILGIVYFLLFYKHGLKPKENGPARVPRPDVAERNIEEDEEEENIDNTEGKTKKQIAKEAKRQEKKEKREVNP